MLIVFAFCIVPDIWISEDDLLLIEGEISSADYYITKSTDNRGHTSNISEVIFYLYSKDYQFLIRKNIEQDYHYEPHQKIQHHLHRSHSAKVWIKKSDINNYKPAIYRLSADDIELISIDDVKDKYRGDYLLLLIMGFVALSIPFFINYFSEDKTIEAKES